MQELQPVIWFQFFSAEEDQALQEWEASVLHGPDADGTHPEHASQLPAALAWVKQFFDPHCSAAGRAGDEMDTLQSRDSGTAETAENAGSSGGEALPDTGTSAHTSSSTMHCSAAAAGASRVSGEELYGAPWESESDSDSEDWVLGADEAQRLKTTCGRHQCDS